MKLVIFDIDGTLSNTSKVDNICLLKAFNDILDHKAHESIWEGCEHITDLGVTHHIYREKYNRLPRIYEVNRIRNRLIEYFESYLKKEPGQFAQVPGAVRFFHQLRERRDIAVAIATGCWRASAAFKLTAIGLDHIGLPFAHSDEKISRRDITLDAIEQAKIKYRFKGFDKITYIGDGTWDLDTSRELKLNFIGIDCQKSGNLHKHGANTIFTDFNEPERIMEKIF